MSALFNIKNLIGKEEEIKEEIEVEEDVNDLAKEMVRELTDDEIIEMKEKAKEDRKYRHLKEIDKLDEIETFIRYGDRDKDKAKRYLSKIDAVIDIFKREQNISDLMIVKLLLIEGSTVADLSDKAIEKKRTEMIGGYKLLLRIAEELREDLLEIIADSKPLLFNSDVDKEGYIEEIESNTEDSKIEFTKDIFLEIDPDVHRNKEEVDIDILNSRDNRVIENLIVQRDGYKEIKLTKDTYIHGKNITDSLVSNFTIWVPAALHKALESGYTIFAKEYNYALLFIDGEVRVISPFKPYLLADRSAFLIYSLVDNEIIRIQNISANELYPEVYENADKVNYPVITEVIYRDSRYNYRFVTFGDNDYGFAIEINSGVYIRSVYGKSFFIYNNTIANFTYYSPEIHFMFDLITTGKSEYLPPILYGVTKEHPDRHKANSFVTVTRGIYGKPLIYNGPLNLRLNSLLSEDYLNIPNYNILNFIEEYNREFTVTTGGFLEFNIDIDRVEDGYQLYSLFINGENRLFNYLLFRSYIGEPIIQSNLTPADRRKLEFKEDAVLPIRKHKALLDNAWLNSQVVDEEFKREWFEIEAEEFIEETLNDSNRVINNNFTRYALLYWIEEIYKKSMKESGREIKREVLNSLKSIKDERLRELREILFIGGGYSTINSNLNSKIEEIKSELKISDSSKRSNIFRVRDISPFKDGSEILVKDSNGNSIATTNRDINSSNFHRNIEYEYRRDDYLFRPRDKE